MALKFVSIIYIHYTMDHINISYLSSCYGCLTYRTSIDIGFVFYQRFGLFVISVLASNSLILNYLRYFQIRLGLSLSFLMPIMDCVGFGYR